MEYLMLVTAGLTLRRLNLGKTETICGVFGMTDDLAPHFTVILWRMKTARQCRNKQRTSEGTMQ